MSDSDSPENSDTTELTTDLVARVIAGRATGAERHAYLRAFRDPHSKIHDWLEIIGTWTEKVLKSNNAGTREAERMINLQLLVRDRNDLVTFIRCKNASGQLTDDNLSAILSLGRLDDQEVPHTPQSYGRSTHRMLGAMHQLCPKLLEELMELLDRRDRSHPP